ncbi:MAG: MjaI family restriction endonuclease [bacterium]
MKRVAETLGKVYRMSDPEEEAKGIDGYIDEVPISIKP